MKWYFWTNTKWYLWRAAEGSIFLDQPSLVTSFSSLLYEILCICICNFIGIHICNCVFFCISICIVGWKSWRTANIYICFIFIFWLSAVDSSCTRQTVLSISQPAVSSFHIFVFVYEYVFDFLFVLCLNLYLYLSTILMSFSFAPFRACLVVTFLGWVVILCENGSFFCIKNFSFLVLFHTAPFITYLG